MNNLFKLFSFINDTGYVTLPRMWEVSGDVVTTPYKICDYNRFYTSIRNNSPAYPKMNNTLLLNTEDKSIRFTPSKHIQQGIITFGLRLFNVYETATAPPCGIISIITEDENETYSFTVDTDINFAYVEIVYDFTDNSVMLYIDDTYIKTFIPTAKVTNVLINSHGGTYADYLVFGDAYITHDAYIDSKTYGRLGPIITNTRDVKTLDIKNYFSYNSDGSTLLTYYKKVKTFEDKWGVTIYPETEIKLTPNTANINYTLPIVGLVVSQTHSASHDNLLNGVLTVHDGNEDLVNSMLYRPKYMNQLFIENVDNNLTNEMISEMTVILTATTEAL